MSGRLSRSLVMFAVCLSLAGIVSHAATPQAPGAPPRPQFGARTEAVLVDVSVTDDKGHPITDLTREDFQVFEDGALQRILTFALHPGSAGAPPGGRRAGADRTGDPTTTAQQGGGSSRLVALVFERLSPEGRRLATQAAKQFVGDMAADEFAGVFVIDQTLLTVAPYTSDHDRLNGAIDKVAHMASTLLQGERNAQLDQSGLAVDMPWVAGADSPGRPATSMPWSDPVENAAKASNIDRRLLPVLLRMERSYQDLVYEMQGRTSMNALLALVDAVGSVNGRKAVLLFAEGLTVPPSAEAKYRAIIDTANNKNVTVYSLDAAGLRVHSKQSETAMNVLQIGGMGVGDAPHGDKYLKALEDNERNLKLDPAVSLGILASETGGLLINNTNDLSKGVRRIDGHWRNFYLLSYSPPTAAQDGSFRKLSVLVSRPGVRVRARSGYRALPTSDAGPVQAYEVPALAAISAHPSPQDFAVDAGAFSAPMPGQPGLIAVLANIPGQSVSLRAAPDGKTFEGEVVVVAHVGAGPTDLPRKLSQQYQLRGNTDRVKETRLKRLLFFRTTEVLPGEHDVAVSVYDGPAQRSSVIHNTVRVPAPSPTLIGDLVLIDHAEPLNTGAQDTVNPFASDKLSFIPTRNATVHRSERQEVNFALAVVLDPKAPVPLATLSLVQQGAALATIPLALPTPGKDGRLLVAGRVPLAKITPGEYELAVAIGQGGGTQLRRTPLIVEP
jgi:VWFA-related protein